MTSDGEGVSPDPRAHYTRAWAQALEDRSTDPAECTPDEVDFTITWRTVGDDVLRGVVRARNICDRVWRLTGKPTVVRVGATGRALPENHMITLEGRFRDWVLVRPGEPVDAPVSISGWDGTDHADYVLIRWPGGVKAALVQGPTHPSALAGFPAITSSSWFAPPNLSLAAPQPQLDEHMDDQGGSASDADVQRASQTPRDLLAAAGNGHASSSNGELADFVAARLDALSKALHQLHRLRCGTPPAAFALDRDGHRYSVPPCLCDTDIRRTQRLITAHQDVVRIARDDDAAGHRILRALADAYADHRDYPPA